MKDWTAFQAEQMSYFRSLPKAEKDEFLQAYKRLTKCNELDAGMSSSCRSKVTHNNELNVIHLSRPWLLERTRCLRLLVEGPIERTEKHSQTRISPNKAPAQSAGAPGPQILTRP